MEKIDQIIEFLKDLQGTCATQICGYTYVSNLSDALINGENMYFCCGLYDKLGTGKNGRCNDDDIKMKKYFIIDIDIRSDYFKETKIILSDEELEQEIDKIFEIIDNDEKFSQYSYAVHSGNGLHLYYVGTETVFEKEVYRRGVESIYDLFVKQTGIKCDYATSNIGSLIRLPGSVNYAREKKYGLGALEAQFIRWKKRHSEIFDTITKIGQKYLKEQEARQLKAKQEAIEKRKTIELDGGGAIFDMINQIDIGELFCEQTSCKMHENKKDILSPKDGKNIGAFIIDNILYFKGTRYLSGKIDGYNTFNYIKYEILSTVDDGDVFEYARNNWNAVKDEDNIRRKERAKSKKENKIDVASLPKIQTSETIKDPKTFDEMGLLRFSTGVTEINDIVGHFRSNELVLLHGASKNGKTMLTMSIANDNGASGIKTAFFSLEMDLEKLKTQQSCIRAGIDRTTFEMGKYTDLQWNKYCSVYKNFDKYFTIFDETVFTETLSSEYVCSQIEKLHKEDGYELFIIDSLQLMLGDNHSDQNRLQAKCIKDLKTLKNRLGVCIILIHHNNKGGETFSGAQELENFSDWRITIKKELDPDANGISIFHKTIITIGKERLGKELEFEFNFDRGNLIYTNHGYASKTK